MANGEREVKLTRAGSFVSLGLVLGMVGALTYGLRTISAIESRIVVAETQMGSVATSLGRIETQLATMNLAHTADVQRIRDMQTEIRLKLERLEAFHK